MAEAAAGRRVSTPAAVAAPIPIAMPGIVGAESRRPRLLLCGLVTATKTARTQDQPARGCEVEAAVAAVGCLKADSAAAVVVAVVAVETQAVVGEEDSAVDLTRDASDTRPVDVVVVVAALEGTAVAVSTPVAAADVQIHVVRYQRLVVAVMAAGSRTVLLADDAAVPCREVVAVAAVC